MKKLGYWILWLLMMTIVWLNYLQTFAEWNLALEYAPTQWGADAISSIQIEFCHTGENIKIVNGKELFINTEPNKPSEMCLRLQNISDISYSLNVNFVDGMYNNMWNKSCGLEESKTLFGQYVDGYDNQILLKWWEIKEIHPIVSLPASSIGKFLGCLTLSPMIAWWDTNKVWWGMSIIVRRGVAIEVRNKGTVNTALEITSRIVSNLWKLVFENIHFTVHKIKKRHYTMQVWVINSGMVSEDVNISATITDLLWRTKLMWNKSMKLVAGQSDLVSFSNRIPRYRMRFTVAISVKHTPDVTGIPLEDIVWVKETETRIARGTFFVFPRRLVIALLILFIVLYGTFRTKKKKKIYWQWEIASTQEISDVKH